MAFSDAGPHDVYGGSTTREADSATTFIDNTTAANFIQKFGQPWQLSHESLN